jgi:predicted GNAT family acetyltransferase
MAEAQTRITDNPDEDRYELFLDEELVAIIEYHSEPGVMALTHTEVLEAYEGQGLASRIVASALQDIRNRGLKLLPLCPYVQAYLGRHPEERDVVLGSSG